MVPELATQIMLSEHARAKLVPELVYTAIPDGSERGARSGGVFNAQGELTYDWASNTAYLNGQCSAYGSDSGAPKPLATRVQAGASTSCMAREAYTELNTDTLSFTAGKRALDFSNALLTSPSNPSTAGTTLVSPLLPQEGVWTINGKFKPTAQLTAQAGAVLADNTGENIRLPLLNPFARVKYSGDTLDGWLTGAQRFGGLGSAWQANEALLFYVEANSKRDGLGGAQWVSPATGLRSTFEYYRNGQGSPGDSRVALRDRREVYEFPTPNSLSRPRWGLTDFLSRDLLFIDVRHAAGTNGAGPYLSALKSANDPSFLSIAGYGLSLKGLKLGLPWFVSLEWRHFGGGAGTDFGEAARSVGRNQFLLTLTVR